MMKIVLVALAAVGCAGPGSAAAPPARQRAVVYLDPVPFCAAVGTTPDIVYRSTERRYRGPEQPAWLLRAVGVDPAGGYVPYVDWRCRNGRVLACIEGNSGMNAAICFRQGGRFDPSVWTDVTPRRR